MSGRIPVWIDTDPGVDDSFAVLCALKDERLDVRGISAVMGNAEQKYTYKNARNLAHFANRDEVPVYAGSEVPLFKKLRTAPLIHGETGISDAVLEESSAPHTSLSAWDALYKEAKAQNGALRLVTLGPLTNIAKAFMKYPELPDLLEGIYIMGGAAEGGNITPCAEFNVYVDPHAAETVFRTGKKVYMFGLDVTQKAYLTDAEYWGIVKGEGRMAEFFRKSTVHILRLKENPQGFELYLHDVCPVAYLHEPSLFYGEMAKVHAETEGTITSGKTVTDLWSDKSFAEEANTKVMLEVNREALIRYMTDMLKKIQ